MGCNIFKDDTKMVKDDTVDVVDAPVKVRLVPKDGAGALESYKLGAGNIGVVSVARPRRGHDY